jgi:hypothetical protein
LGVRDGFTDTRNGHILSPARGFIWIDEFEFWWPKRTPAF